MPELRLFWIFLLLIIALLVIDIFYLPFLWVGISLVITLVSGTIVFWNGVKLARSNLELKVAAGRLERIVTDSDDGVIAYDGNFQILTFNPAAERIFGINKEEVLGQQFGPERAQTDRFRFLAQTIFPSLAPTVVQRSEPGEYPQIADLSFSEPIRELRVSTNRIIGPQNQVLGFIKLVRDRTREIELLRSKSDFITIAAHQLRTPLTAIHWTFEGLAAKNLNPEDKELATRGLNDSVKLLKIVNDLLDVSKIEEGRFGYDFREVNIIDFLAGILANAQVLAKRYEVQLYFDHGKESTINVTVDEERLGLALSNFLDNAIKYNVKNGTVTVKVERLTGKPLLQISIKDTGVGIPADEMNKLFTKFFRAENAMKLETEGSGLGLYIAKNIINRHGGVVWAESVVNRGTTIYFTLPLDPSLIPPKETAIMSE